MTTATANAFRLLRERYPGLTWSDPVAADHGRTLVDSTCRTVFGTLLSHGWLEVFSTSDHRLRVYDPTGVVRML